VRAREEDIKIKTTSALDWAEVAASMGATCGGINHTRSSINLIYGHEAL
jgi:hypothetical protein